jgi:NADH-quinone oxidoreductase subunit C
MGTVLDDTESELLARLEAELGADAVLESANSFGTLVVRVDPTRWSDVAVIARSTLGCDYLSFVSGIDWMPRPSDDVEEGDTSTPAQPTDQTPGLAGSAGRFQVFAHVQSTSDHYGITFKADVDEAEPRIASWTATYPGADWHERETWEMYGVIFDGHPALRHLYLPAEFEGHPLRKDFALLARVVKPWPGLVDVEPMPGDGDEASEGGDA